MTQKSSDLLFVEGFQDIFLTSICSNINGNHSCLQSGTVKEGWAWEGLSPPPPNNFQNCISNSSSNDHAISYFNV